MFDRHPQLLELQDLQGTRPGGCVQLVGTCPKRSPRSQARMGKQRQAQFMRSPRPRWKWWRSMTCAAGVRCHRSRRRSAFGGQALVLCHHRARPPRLDFGGIPAAQRGGHLGRTYLDLLSGAASRPTRPNLLDLHHYQKALNLPTFCTDAGKLAAVCPPRALRHTGYLLRLAETESIEREREMVEKSRSRRPGVPGGRPRLATDFTGATVAQQGARYWNWRSEAACCVGERRRWQRRHRLRDPWRSRPGAGSLRAVGRLHHGGRLVSRAARGLGKHGC